ncbi:MAG: glycogen synthase GlgA, partial [Planctomycetes bacterium]|nr:glycogen synthase GlgA [Planctomycetota bacterium]
MRVLEIASEAVPFAKTGGLADVAGALPDALAGLGCDVSLVIPAHAEALGKGLPVEPTGIEFDVPIGSRVRPARILRCPRPGGRAAVYLVANDDLFGRPTLYGGARDYPDNAERFIFFSRAAVELACRLGGPWDVLHCHDWQTGLVPAYRRLLSGAHPAVARSSTVMTIHNLAYQGLFWHWDML